MPISANFVCLLGREDPLGDLSRRVPQARQGGRRQQVARRPQHLRRRRPTRSAEAYVQKPAKPCDWYYDYMFQVYSRGMKAPPAGASGPKRRRRASPTRCVRDNFVIYGSSRRRWRASCSPSGTKSARSERWMMTAHDWSDKAIMRRSMELLANDVMPRVNAGAECDTSGVKPCPAETAMTEPTVLKPGRLWWNWFGEQYSSRATRCARAPKRRCARRCWRRAGSACRCGRAARAIPTPRWCRRRACISTSTISGRSSRSTRRAAGHDPAGHAGRRGQPLSAHAGHVAQ